MASAIRVRIVLLILLVLCIGGGLLMDQRRERHAPRADLTLIPLTVAGVAGLENELDDGIQGILKATQTLNRRYEDGEDVYWLFVGYFAQQRFGSQIHSPRHCYPGSGWNVLITGKMDQVGDTPSRKLVIQKNKERRVVLYHYQTRGGLTTSELRLKTELALSSLLGRPLDAAFVRFSTRVLEAESDDEALTRLADFTRQLGPGIDRGLPF